MMAVVSKGRKLKTRRGDVLTSTATTPFFQRPFLEGACCTLGKLQINGGLPCCYETRENSMPVQTTDYGGPRLNGINQLADGLATTPS